MKSLVIFSGLLISSAGFAQSLNFERINNCMTWNYSPEARGYICASYPWTVNVPNYFDTSEALRLLNERVKALEAKVQSLEAQIR